MTPSSWHISLFGTLQAQRGSHKVDKFRTQKTAALLALLTLRGSQSRESVCAFLWPDSEPGAARSSLSTALSSLRRDLGEDVLEGDRNKVSLVPGAVATDVTEFDAALKSDNFARAVELYRGPLLPGFHEDPFPALAGEYQEKARHAFGARLKELDANGHPDEALIVSRRAIALFGNDQRWFLALMRAHYGLDDWEAALRVYNAMGRFATKGGEPILDEARQLAKSIRLATARGEAPIALPSVANGEASVDGASQLQEEAFTDLPTQWTRFFGRESERDVLNEWLQKGERLITLSGSGGSGKTRLAIETVREMKHSWGGPIYFVPLASLSDVGLLFSTIRDSLKVAASSDLPPVEQIERALSGQRVLLVLDNFEQLVSQGAQLLQELRERLPLATWMVTSRVVLNLPGEREFALSPLPTPLQNTSSEAMSYYASAALFCDRSGLTLDRSNADAVGMLCRRLDGIPLALELAAARAKVLSPSQILERLERHSDFLSSRELGLPARHKTLRAAIEWSADLLSPELREFFCRLCVFRGGFTLEAAEKIAAPSVCQEWEALDFLEQLRGHSLLQTLETENGTRYRLLEMLREWAQGQLNEEQLEALRTRHLSFFLEEAERTLDFSVLIERQHILEADQANFRASLSYAFEREFALAARLVGALSGFWELRSHFAEGCNWARRALERASELDLPVRARLLRGAGILFWYGGDLRQARDTLALSVELYERLDDEEGLAHALDMLGKAQMVRNQPEDGGRNGERAVAIARRRGDTARLASALVTQAWGLTNTKRPLESNPHLEEALCIAERVGEPRLRAVCLGTQTLNFWGAGDEAQARANCALLLRECEADIELYSRCFLREVVVIVACGLGDWELARPLMSPVARDLFSMGARWEFISLIYVAARFALRHRDVERAALLFSAAHARCQSNGYNLAGCLVEFELNAGELQDLRSDAVAQAAWTRGAHLRDEDVVALIGELSRSM